MNFNSMRIIMLSTATLLCPAAISAQDGGAYMQASMAQADASQPEQQQPGQAGQQPSTRSMDSGSTGERAQVIKDKMFLRQAAEGGMAEVQLGKLAAQKAASDDVKTFGQKMVDDHTMLNKEMEPVADSLGVKLPTHLNKKDQAEYDKLNGLSGNDFDTEYLTTMVMDHHKDLREFRMEAANTQDQTLKDAVVKAEKVIHEHLVMVNKLAKDKGVALPGRNGSQPAAPPAP